MKYYSEILSKFFDTEKECEDAEREEKDKALKIKEEEERLFLAAKEAKNKLDAACEDYEKAKKEADEIMKEARKTCTTILNTAKDSMYKCTKDTYHALLEYYKKFGYFPW